MAPPPTVLILDPDAQTRRNTVFLLHLARYEVTESRNDIEALNWIEQRRCAGSPFDALILSDTLPESVRAEMAGALTRKGDALPILLIERGGKKDSASSGAAGATDVPPVRCAPGDVLEQLSRILMTSEREERTYP